MAVASVRQGESEVEVLSSKSCISLWAQKLSFKTTIIFLQIITLFLFVIILFLLTAPVGELLNFLDSIY